jgi:cytochrome c553
MKQSKNSRFATCAALILTCLSFTVGSISAEPLVKSCVACHGEDGVSANADWPNLAGQNTVYLVDQLKAFRSGDRKNILMDSVLGILSDENIQKLASHYSNKPASIAANGNKKIVAAGENDSAYCVSCHGMKGQTANSEWPDLAGQNAGYLELQLRAFRDGTRVNTNMNTIVAGYSDEKIKALAAYYSQLNP